MITSTYVDGVRLLTAPTTGQARGGITFRVGYSDEPFQYTGATHLVEHLALHHLGQTDYHFNGTTAPYMTHFFSQGTPDEVTTFITRVCQALCDLPLDRLDLEKQVLRTEADGRSPSMGEWMRTWRHGVSGQLSEWGLPGMTPAMVADWTRRHFTRENAVVWFAGPEAPPSWSLPLPSGVPLPMPVRREMVDAYPAYFSQGSRTIGWQAIVGRSMAASVYSDVLRRHMFRELRQQHGYSYTVDTDYSPVDAQHASLMCLADSGATTTDAALGGFIDLMTQSRWGGLHADDVASAIGAARRSLDDPDWEALTLPSGCFDLLTGAPTSTREELLAEIELIDDAALHAVAEEAARSALLCVPVGLRADWAGYALAPTSIHGPVEGTEVAPVEPSTQRLVLSAQGITVRTPPASRTVRFDDCAGMLAWPDGARRLVAMDATTIHIEPTLWRLDPGVRAWIDQSIPADKVAWQPARSPDAIPVPAVETVAGASGAGATPVPTSGTPGRGPGTTGTPVAPVRQPTVMMGVWIFLLVVSIVWLAWTISGWVYDPNAGLGLTVLGVPIWMATIWVSLAYRKRLRAWKQSVPRKPTDRRR
ncbi:MAG: hypothetical protein FWD75_00430 [Propionibacteriaceae bacterium]|nr:hypothetical protein [Propionibacteriaceae bacterium]